MQFWLLGMLLVLGSCASHKLSSNPSYLHSSDYNSRPELSDSFLSKKEGNLSNEDISRLLNSKVSFNGPVKVAILKLGHSGNHEWINNSQYEMQETISEKNQEQFKTLTEKSKKIKSIAFVPNFLMPKDKTLANLRDIAALVQAQFLLILKTESRSNFDLNILDSDEALTIATVQAALMDVSTGAIPYTAIITGNSKTKKTKDYNYEEFMIRSRKEAEEEAYNSLFKDIEVLFN